MDNAKSVDSKTAVRSRSELRGYFGWQSSTIAALDDRFPKYMDDYDNHTLRFVSCGGGCLRIRLFRLFYMSGMFWSQFQSMKLELMDSQASNASYVKGTSTGIIASDTVNLGQVMQAHNVKLGELAQKKGQSF